MKIPNWVLRCDGEYFGGFAAGGDIQCVARSEYAMTFISFGTAQQFAHELEELTGERWEVASAG